MGGNTSTHPNGPINNHGNFTHPTVKTLGRIRAESGQPQKCPFYPVFRLPVSPALPHPVKTAKKYFSGRKCARVRKSLRVNTRKRCKDSRRFALIPRNSGICTQSAWLIYPISRATGALVEFSLNDPAHLFPHCFTHKAIRHGITF